MPETACVIPTRAVFSCLVLGRPGALRDLSLGSARLLAMSRADQAWRGARRAERPIVSASG